MEQHKIHAAKFLHMMRLGAKSLSDHLDQVNALNVFPVPDGDTGTNMSLTITSGVKEMEKNSQATSVGKLAEALSKGLLMGARGNSGVILSQLFRGFSKAVAKYDSINAKQLADAFKRGVDTAYRAVIKPVEGTILTVARESAEAGIKRSWKTEDPVEIMEAILKEAKASLARTPKLLPVLKQTGVVDAGGQGLVFIYEGMLSALKEETVEEELHFVSDVELFESVHENAQAKIDPSEIEFGYCTEFIIDLNTTRRKTEVFVEETFRKEMARFGDSLLVVADDDWVKVHIHAEYPGDALNHAMRYGDLTRIKIDNMREQYKNVTEKHAAHQKEFQTSSDQEIEKKKYGLVAVASGKGIADIFKSVGVDVVIEGGQTMNPSTEEIAQAIHKLSVEHVIILPNNKNIILTAEQVGELVEVPVTVIPTRTIPQGLAALLGFHAEAEPEENKQSMMEAYQGVRSGELTYAIRDSNVDGHEIQKGDYLGICEGKIDVVGKDMHEVALSLLDRMIGEEAEMLTILYGQEVDEENVNALVQALEKKYPDIELEVHKGDQPVYYYLFAVE